MGEVEDLVARAAGNDEAAWSLLVDRFAGLVWTVVRSVGLTQTDAADVCQTTWMRLAEHLDDLRDATRLGAWLSTTARREAIRVSRLGSRHVPVDPWEWLDQPQESAEDPETAAMDSERAVAIQAAVGVLPERCRQLLMSLASDPPTPYQQLSELLGVPIGSIGPTRSRCLQRLERLLREATEVGDIDSIPARTYQ
ncbi:MAG TPA: sigma-70 family RNA polymerase sigma factor [Acidimicrobiales bacterium]|nr:sigma-70 family RNA polymerase sigma factor [Acidimicrobiales bacterium]